jgi:hypothetical protein
MVSKEKLKLLSWHIQGIENYPKKNRNEKIMIVRDQKVEKENLKTFENR